MTQTTVEEPFPGGIEARTKRRATLEKQRYIAPSTPETEWEGVWTRCWLFAGLESDLPDAGDYFVYNLGRESIVVLRDDDETIRAFYNVCQHRGNRLLASESGSIAQVACPYHGWTYGLDGQLLEIPDEERFCPAVEKSERSLKPVKVAQWAGMVWLNMDPESQSLEEYLGPIMANLAPYRFEKMVLAQHQTVSIDANWKTARDNFLEQYHVDFIHPQHATLVDCCNSTNILWPYGHSATMVEGYVTNSRYPEPEETPVHLVELLKGIGLDPKDFDGRVSQIRETVQKHKREVGEQLGFDYSPLSDEQVTDVWQYDIFPNTFMTIQAEELWIYGPRPHPSDPNKCFFDKWTLQIPMEIGSDSERGLTLNPRLMVGRDDERPQHEVFTAEDVIQGKHSLTITIDQDIYYLADMQAGMHSRGFDSALLNQDEVRVQHFHDWLDAYLGK
ncbi:MAG: phenylpropionate dioxygenase-like ring-hydroxylating dioxygenase large terminal subunit [Halioglobus sp.]|jgi:phenylpropionate dioxygenase-like ring-hydroxylating dioxygenase large terminal subunit